MTSEEVPGPLQCPELEVILEEEEDDHLAGFSVFEESLQGVMGASE